MKFVVNKERMLVIKVVLYKPYPAVKSQSHDYRPMQKTSVVKNNEGLDF